MTCPNCGAAVADNRRFCGKCGTDLPPTTAGRATSGDPPGTSRPPPPAPGARRCARAPAPSAQPAAPRRPARSVRTARPEPPPGYGAPGYPPPDTAHRPARIPPPGTPPPGYGPPPGLPAARLSRAGPGPPPGAWPGLRTAAHTTASRSRASCSGSSAGRLCGIGSVVAIVLGFVALDQIKQSGGRQTGSGMATAGIVLGFIGARVLVPSSSSGASSTPELTDPPATCGSGSGRTADTRQGTRCRPRLQRNPTPPVHDARAEIDRLMSELHGLVSGSESSACAAVDEALPDRGEAAGRDRERRRVQPVAPAGRSRPSSSPSPTGA